MPIQIIDNFELGAAKPIDNRFVVGPGEFYTDKSLIPNKYAGLRVWDLTGGSPGSPYVWDGTAWQTEASSGISGSGTPGYIPKFIGSGGVIDDSIIREDSGNIGIGILPAKKLHVNGDLQSDGSGGYYGIGTNLTALNATNITTGILGLARLQNGTSGYILTSGSGSPTWTNPSTITVGNATNTTNIGISLDTTTTSVRRIPFINTSSSSGSFGLRVNNGFTYQPSNNTLYVQGGIGIGTSPSSSYRLRVSGTSYLSGNVGIGTSPSSSYRLRVSGTSYLNGNVGIGVAPSSDRLLVDGTIKSGGLHLGNPLQIYHRLVIDGSADLQEGLYMNVGFNSGGWRASSTDPGLALFYQTFASENKYILYTNSSTTPGSPVTLNPVIKIDPNTTSPNVEVAGGMLLNRSDNTNYTLRISNGGGSAKCLRINAGSQDNDQAVWIFASHFSGYASPDYFIVRGDGEVDAGAFNNLSDARIKENVTTISYDKSIINSLRPVTYNKISDEDNKLRAGFIAQEVEEVLPHLVRTTEHPDHEKEDYGGLRGIKHLDYISLIPYIVAELQEKDRIITDLQKRIKDLES